MEAIKREKLIIISPSGKERTVGFLSPCADGFVIGTNKIDDKSPAHLTVLNKDDVVSSHITYQDNSVKAQRFPPMTTSAISQQIESLIEK